MKYNVIITPKKPEIVECDSMTEQNGSLIFWRGKAGRKPGYICAAFKKWIRVYIMPDKK